MTHTVPILDLNYTTWVSNLTTDDLGDIIFTIGNQLLKVNKDFVEQGHRFNTADTKVCLKKLVSVALLEYEKRIIQSHIYSTALEEFKVEVSPEDTIDVISLRNISDSFPLPCGYALVRGVTHPSEVYIKAHRKYYRDFREEQAFDVVPEWFNE